MFIITNLDTDKLEVTVLDTDDNVKEPASIKDFISYLKAGVDFKGVSIEKDKDTNWSITVPTEDTSEVYNIFYNINNDVCTGIEKVSDKDTEESKVEPEASVSEDFESVSDTDIATEKKPDEAVPEPVDNSIDAEELESKDKGVSVETQSECRSADCDIKGEPNCEVTDTDSDEVITATVDAICECKSAKKSDKKPAKKSRAKKTKAGETKAVETSTKDILSYLVSLSNVLDYRIENPYIINASNADKFMFIDSTCSDFVFFKGKNITISINGDYANNFAIKDEILKHLSKIPFKTSDGKLINLYEECCGVSNKLSVYPPFSSELGVSDSDDVLVITINSLANV